MGFRSRPVPVPETAKDYVDRRTCIACQRTGTPVEHRTIGDGTEAWLCVNTRDCTEHWEPADA